MNCSVYVFGRIYQFFISFAIIPDAGGMLGAFLQSKFNFNFHKHRPWIWKLGDLEIAYAGNVLIQSNQANTL